MPDFEKFRVGSTDYNVKDASAAHVYVGSGTAPAGTTIKIDPDGDAAVILEDAPSDGNQYARQNGAWTAVTGGGTASRWANKNVLVIGDSTSDPGSGYPNHGHPWQETTGTELGCNIFSHAKGSATLLDMINGSSNPQIAALTQQDVTGKDLIILYGGANDASTDHVQLGQVGDLYTSRGSAGDTLCGRLYYAVRRIYQLLAAANNLACRVMLVAYYNSGAELGDERWTQAAEDVAHWLGIPCINLRKTSGINPATWSLYGYSSGDMHLGSAGNVLVGKQIARFIDREV